MGKLNRRIRRQPDAEIELSYVSVILLKHIQHFWNTVRAKYLDVIGADCDYHCSYPLMAKYKKVKITQISLLL